MQPPTETWEGLIPTSFQATLYLPSLKIAVTAGSFILYHKGDTSTAPQVGRILSVAPSISSIPHAQNHPLIHLPFPDSDLPVQFAKVNVFQDRSLVTDPNVPVNANSSVFDGWQQVVQLDETIWIPSHVILGLAFVFMEDYLHLNSFYDCRGMKNVFLLKFRISQDGNVSVVPKEECPPFPSFIESFSKLWSLCYCELIFNSIRLSTSKPVRVN